MDDHVKAGLAVESDRMSAQVNEAAMKQGLIAAQGELELAWAQLRRGRWARRTLQAIEAAGHRAEEISRRPALEQELQTAAKSTSGSGRAGTGAIGAGVGGERSEVELWTPRERLRQLGRRPWRWDSGGHNWVAGVQIGIDVLPFSKRAQLARETAAKARVDAQVNSYQQQVRLQVSQAHIQRQTAKQSLDTARAAIDQATEEPAHSQQPVRRRAGHHHRSAARRGCRAAGAGELLACGLRQCRGVCGNTISRPGL